MKSISALSLLAATWCVMIACCSSNRENWFEIPCFGHPAPAGLALLLRASSANGSNVANCSMRVVDDGRTVELMASDDRLGFEGVETQAIVFFPDKDCYAELPAADGLNPQQVRYYGFVLKDGDGVVASGTHEIVELALTRHERGSYTPVLGWNAAKQVYCKLSEGEDLVCCGLPPEDAGYAGDGASTE